MTTIGRLKMSTGHNEGLLSPVNNGIIGVNPVKLNEYFQLEEVTHFQRINKNLEPSPNLVSTEEDEDDNSCRGAKLLDSGIGCDDDRYTGGSSSSSSSCTRSPFNVFATEKRERESESCNRSNGGGGGGSCNNVDECDSKIVSRAESYSSEMLDIEPGTSRREGMRSCQKDELFSEEDPQDENQYQEEYWRRDHAQMTFHPFNDSFVLDVKRTDVILDAIVFFTILGEFLTDVTMAIWHYRDGFRWSAGVTLFFIILGAASMLHQFNNYLQEPDIKRIFGRGKRIRILVNCFTPLATILSSLRCLHLGYKATWDPMISSQYLEVENFCKTLYKTQSVFQSAPLATVQLVILIESLHDGSIGLLKALVSILNIALCWSVMTNSNLPSKAEDYDHVKKVSQSPSQRLYIGLRMFSSFASRTMAVTSLLISSRCLLGPSNSLQALFIGIIIMLVPRDIFFCVDFIRQRIVSGRNRQGSVSGGSSSSNVEGGRSGRRRMSCCESFMGYMATILFPVGHPVWIFWYIWAETALFVISGNILGWSKGCLSNAINATYTGVFLLLFIIIPIIVPLARVSVKQRRIRKAENFFQSHHNSKQGGSKPTATSSSSQVPTTDAGDRRASSTE